MRRRLGLLTLVRLIALCCVACSQPEPHTQLLVWVRADTQLSARLQQVRVGIYPDNETNDTEPRREQRFDITSGKARGREHSLPFSFSIVAGESYSLVLVVRGYASRDAEASAVVEQRLDVSFLPRRTLEVSVLLETAQPVCNADFPEMCLPPSAATAQPDPSTQLASCEDLEDGVCDPVAQCNCEAPEQCQVVNDDQGSCAIGGSRGKNEYCEYPAQCVGNLSCAWGACRHACHTRDDCAAHVSATAECVRRGPQRYGFCAEPCAKPGAPSCPDELICSPLKTETVEDSFCLRVEDQCTTTDDGVCDEAGRGTGFCEADSDANDCCSQSRAGGDCSPITQCGCAADQACRATFVLDGFLFSECAQSGPGAIGSVCEQDSDCVRGAGCHQSLCKRLCDASGLGRCRSGECVPLSSEDSFFPGLGSCWQACDWKTHQPCSPDTVCAQLERGYFCHVQASACPDELRDNGICDELTRVCAPGTDSDADCER